MREVQGRRLCAGTQLHGPGINQLAVLGPNLEAVPRHGEAMSNDIIGGLAIAFGLTAVQVPLSGGSAASLKPWR